MTPSHQTHRIQLTKARGGCVLGMLSCPPSQHQFSTGNCALTAHSIAAACWTDARDPPSLASYGDSPGWDQELDTVREERVDGVDPAQLSSLYCNRPAPSRGCLCSHQPLRDGSTGSCITAVDRDGRGKPQSQIFCRFT